MAKVSIIVPIYNIEAYLRDCVDSLLGQTLEDIEIILVDDGSTDTCGGICDEYAATDDRIRVIHKANGGLSDARNAGIDVAQSDYIGFVDGDDRVMPEMFKSLYRACREHGTRIAACDRAEYLIGREGLVTHSDGHCQVMTAEDFFAKVLWQGSPVGMGVWNKLYEKSLFDAVRFPKGKLHEDTAVLYRLVFQVDLITYLSQPYYIYIQRAGSITTLRYGARDHDRYEANYGMFCYISENHPVLIAAAAENHCLSNLAIVRNMCASGIYDKKMYRTIKRDTRKLLPTVLKNSNLLQQTKRELQFLCVGYYPYRRICRINKQRKRVR